MTADSTDQPAPLLPTFANNPGADYRLRRSLGRLRDQTSNESLRRKISDVLEGRSTLRALSDDPEFQEFTRPRAQRTFSVWNRMDQADKDKLVEEAQAQHEARLARAKAAGSRDAYFDDNE